MDGTTATFAPDAGKTLVFNGVVRDLGFEGPYPSGSFLTVLTGGATVNIGDGTSTGTVQLGDPAKSGFFDTPAAYTFNLKSGTLHLVGATYAEDVNFGAGSQTLAIDSAAFNGNSLRNFFINSFGVGDIIRLPDLAYSASATATWAANTGAPWDDQISVTSGGSTYWMSMLTPTSYTFSVRDDGTGGSIVYINTAPTDIELSPGSVDEDAAAGTVVGTLTVVDTDPGDTATYALVNGIGDADNALFEIVDDELRVAAGAQLDFEQHPTYSVRVSVTDAAGSSFEKILTITVGDIGENVCLTEGVDNFAAPTGTNVVHALHGVDTITFDFKLTEATITYDNDKVIIDGPGGSHSVVSGFEKYVFTDGTVNNADGNDLVDDLFYFSRNHDVWNAHLDADAHYEQVGWRQLRDPNEFFSTVLYLSEHPELKGGNVSPTAHFHQTGWTSGLAPSLNFDPDAYLDANPDVKAAGLDPLEHFLYWGRQEGRQAIAPTEIIGKGGFDYVWYLQQNPDVAAAHVDPLLHFQTYGWKEGRDPNAFFDTSGYLAVYTDVAAIGMNPLDHYNQYGWKEGRDPSLDFDTKAYLAINTDVAAAQMNPLIHYLTYGQHEGRVAIADTTWWGA